MRSPAGTPSGRVTARTPAFRARTAAAPTGDTRAKVVPVPPASGKPSERGPSFVEAFTEGQETVAHRPLLGDAWRLQEFWKDGLQDPMKVVDAFVMPIVHAALDRKARLKASGAAYKPIKEEGETMLDHMVQITDGKHEDGGLRRRSDHALDPKMIKDELLSTLLAGRDTVSMSTLH